MGKDIQQSVELPATPEALFEMYVDAKQHSALTGSEVTVSREPGSAFSAFGGALSGRMVATVPGRIDLVHTGVADRDYEGVTEGWRKYYWDPWRAFLQARETPT